MQLYCHAYHLHRLCNSSNYGARPTSHIHRRSHRNLTRDWPRCASHRDRDARAHYPAQSLQRSGLRQPKWSRECLGEAPRQPECRRVFLTVQDLCGLLEHGLVSWFGGHRDLRDCECGGR